MFSRIIKNKNKPTRYTFIFAAAVFLLVTGMGYIKFNFLDDDIYIEGSSVTVKDIAGTWVEAVPGTIDNASEDKQMQGFMLNEDGTAESVNMHTLLILKWRIDNGYLILTEKSIGNGISSIGEEKYKIITAGRKKLSLMKGSSAFEYTRQR